MNGQRPLCFLAGAIPEFTKSKFYHWAHNRGRYADGLYNSWVTRRTVIYPGHRSCFPAPRCAMPSWSGKEMKVFLRKLPSQSGKRTHLSTRTTSTARTTVVSSGSNGSGYPASNPVSAQKYRSVRFQNRPRTRPAVSWRANPEPLPVNARVLPGLARPVGSNVCFCVSGFSIDGRI